MKSYRIGYKNPPKATRFKPGNREYLKRRKKKKNELEKIIRDFLSTTVAYRDRGKTKRARRIDLQIEGPGSAALKGDVGAADQLLKMRQHGMEIGELHTITLCMDEEDADA